jgi:hypothetical protein
MKSQYLVSCCVFLLTGCQATAPIMKNSITFVVGPSQHNVGFVFKNNWPLCANFYDSNGKMPVKREGKYLTSDSTCKVSPEGYVPSQIIIDYAPWLTYEEQQKIPELRAKQVLIIGDEVRNGVLYKSVVKGKDKEALNYNLTVLAKNEEAAIDKLPASAWKSIVLTPPREVDKYKFQTPEGSGNHSRGKEIHYIISLKPDGTYSIKTELYWKQPYQKNWN